MDMETLATLGNKISHSRDFINFVVVYGDSASAVYVNPTTSEVWLSSNGAKLDYSDFDRFRQPEFFDNQLSAHHQYLTALSAARGVLFAEVAQEVQGSVAVSHILGADTRGVAIPVARTIGFIGDIARMALFKTPKQQMMREQAVLHQSTIDAYVLCSAIIEYGAQRVEGLQLTTVKPLLGTMQEIALLYADGSARWRSALQAVSNESELFYGKRLV